MKKHVLLFVFVFLLSATSFAQSIIKDQAVDNQEQRMVFQQWDQNKFYPKPGFLSLNPYYWLVWGFFYPNYHKTDIRPLGPAGPQTQRLGLVGIQNTEDNKYKLHADTVRNTALSQIASQSGLLSDADPLWLLYYNSVLLTIIHRQLYSARLHPRSVPNSSKMDYTAGTWANWPA
jgi:hypothetical protein